jgi:hypothetical protein
MAGPDQFIKDLFRDETAPATGDRVRFEVPPEVATRSLTPDGRLTRAVAPAQLASLPPPLCCLREEALTDFKMPGDHVGRAALARADLRRGARWVALVEEAEGSKTPDAAGELDPRDLATWVVAPHWPRWIEADQRRGVLTVEDVGRGCRRIGPHDHDVLWIAANELPLLPELLPFLFVRSGRPLVELLTWATTVKSPDWVAGVLQLLPMAAELYEDLHVPTDPEEQRRIHLNVLRRWLELLPEAADEAVQRGSLLPLQHLFERRLRRNLDPSEQAVLRQRLATLGVDRLGDVVLDMDATTLEAWLADPAAH